MKHVLLSAAAAVLLGLTGCGGGSGGGNSASTGLSYQNPSNPSNEFALYLVRDSASTASDLVLDLVCPETSPTVSACGVCFGFDVDTTKAAWSRTVGSGNVFSLGTGVQLDQGWVDATGVRLQGIVSEKGLTSPVADIGDSHALSGTATKVLAQIHLSPAGSATGAVTLADSGLAMILDPSGTPYAIPVLVGTLSRY